MSTRIEYPVTTLADGTAMVVVIPIFATSPGIAPANSLVLPFFSSVIGSTTYPFAVGPGNPSQGPFFANIASMSTFAVDSVSIDFINTQSPLNVAGKL